MAGWWSLSLSPSIVKVRPLSLSVSFYREGEGDWVVVSLSLSPSVVKGGLKLADCAKKAEALWTKDKENIISTINNFAARKAEDIVEQLPATA